MPPGRRCVGGFAGDIHLLHSTLIQVKKVHPNGSYAKSCALEISNMRKTHTILGEDRCVRTVLDRRHLALKRSDARSLRTLRY
jgi:hypothetical protein